MVSSPISSGRQSFAGCETTLVRARGVEVLPATALQPGQTAVVCQADGKLLRENVVSEVDMRLLLLGLSPALMVCEMLKPFMLSLKCLVLAFVADDPELQRGMGRVLQCYLTVTSPETCLLMDPVSQLEQASLDQMVAAWLSCSTDDNFEEGDAAQEVKRRAVLWKIEMTLRVCLQKNKHEGKDCSGPPSFSSSPSPERGTGLPSAAHSTPGHSSSSDGGGLFRQGGSSTESPEAAASPAAASPEHSPAASDQEATYLARIGDTKAPYGAMPYPEFSALVEELVTFNGCRHVRNTNHAHPLSNPDDLRREEFFTMFSKMLSIKHKALSGVARLAAMALPHAEEAAAKRAEVRKARTVNAHKLLAQGGW